MASIYLNPTASIRKFVKFANVVKPLLPSANVMQNSRRHKYGNTIDTADLKHLSKFVGEWWDPEGSLKPLHSYNIIRVPYIRDSFVTVTPDTPASTCLQGKKLLEVGCGAGILSEELAKLGADITGLDPCKELVDAALNHATLNTRLTIKPTYIQGTIEEHCKEHSNEYDGVIASEVIEHIDHTQRELFIESCVKAVKPGGKIIIMTPNRTRMSQLLGIYLVEAIGVIPKGTHHYHKFSTQEEIKYWLEMNDCKVDLIKGYIYYFWRNEWKWIKWQGLMYAMRAVKLGASA